MRDCVVGHYHLHPLHLWQDILLTFGEMELDSTTIFPLGTSVMFIRSTGEPVLAQVVGHSEHGLYFTRDIPEGKWVPKNLFAPAKPPTKKAKPPPKSAAQSIPVESGQHVQEFKVKWSRTKKLGPRNFTPSRSRSRSPYIGSPLNASYAEFFRFMLQFLCLQMCVYSGGVVPQGGWGTVTW